MRPLVLLALAILSSGLVACSEKAMNPVTATKLSQHPLSGLDVIPLTIHQNGKTYEFRVEVARTPEEQEMGLMFRTALGPSEGMIFPKQVPSPASFWMKDTVIPLDLLFIGPDHKVTNIAAKAKPYSTDPISSDGPSAAVLEIAGGRARELGITAGAHVNW